jgi:hypothetical protein
MVAKYRDGTDVTAALDQDLSSGLQEEQRALHIFPAVGTDGQIEPPPKLKALAGAVLVCRFILSPVLGLLCTQCEAGYARLLFLSGELSKSNFFSLPRAA